MKIVSRYYSEETLFECDADTLIQCIHKAVGEGANLREADLSGADLRGAYLREANLRGANLREANLRGANLNEANLSEADLSGAYLSGAYLREANLLGAYLNEANLRGAYLSGAYLREANLLGVPIIKKIHGTVYEAASKDGALDMSTWHTCETTHCRAGWVIKLAGDGGAALDFALGPSYAAALIYIASDPTLEKIPDFYASREESLKDMKRLSDMESAA